MLHLVAERFLRIAERHLIEAEAWMNISAEHDDLFSKRYANQKADWHLDMVKYWHMAVDNLHYKPGTWAYTF